MSSFWLFSSKLACIFDTFLSSSAILNTLNSSLSLGHILNNKHVRNEEIETELQFTELSDSIRYAKKRNYAIILKLAKGVLKSAFNDQGKLIF